MSNVRRAVRLLLAALLVLAISGCSSQDSSTKKSDATRVTNEPPRDSMTIVLRAGDSTTAFDLLKNSHHVDYQSSAIGVFVKGIDSVYGSTDAFWVYSVNDSTPEIASDKFPVHAGDIVRWHLRKATQ